MAQRSLIWIDSQTILQMLKNAVNLLQIFFQLENSLGTRIPRYTIICTSVFERLDLNRSLERPAGTWQQCLSQSPLGSWRVITLFATIFHIVFFFFYCVLPDFFLHLSLSSHRRSAQMEYFLIAKQLYKHCWVCVCLSQIFIW